MQGLRVGITGARKGAELSDALVRKGALVTWGPTVATVPPESDMQLLAETDAILEAQPAWMVASTGAGLRAWVEAAAAHGRGEGLRGLLSASRVAARGPKAAGALRQLDVTPVFVSKIETDADLAAWLSAQLQIGEALAVQVHGNDVGQAYSELQGVTVLRAAAYRCVLPESLEPARRMVEQIVGGDLDVVVSTSAPAAHNLVAIAAQCDRRSALLKALRERVAVAAVGPVTATAFEQEGIPVSIMPTRYRTGELIRALDSWANRRSWTSGDGERPTGPIALVPSGRMALLGTSAISLGEREFAVLASLVRRPHVVVRSGLLALETWGCKAQVYDTQLKQLIFRLRRKLGPAGANLQTVRGVGYRYDPSA